MEEKLEVFGSEEEIFVVCCVQNVGRALVVIILIQTQLGLPGSRQLFLLLLDFLLLILDLKSKDETVRFEPGCISLRQIEDSLLVIH